MPDFQPLDFTSYNNQNQSPLFSVLPPEIRHEIYAYALSEYESIEQKYSKDTYWWRPGNTAALRTATELLRTCRRLYGEAWLMQFALAEHRFYLTQPDRSPGGTWPRGFKKYNRRVHEVYGRYQSSGRSGLGGIRVFAQLWMLEPGSELQKILDVQHFYPKRVAVTIRYSDFWFWERNARLHVDAAWVNRIRLPDSVTYFTVDFEMIERRKDEVNLIANDAVEKWFFERKDGAILTARKEDMSVSTWTGSSVLGGQRWVRDEVRPGQLDYHVVTVTWKLEQRNDCPPRPCPNLDVPRDFIQACPPFTQTDSIHLRNLQDANVSLDTPAAEAWQAMQQYYENAR
ncbi:uncharacterized protein EURHEDRAFT_417144 [Aspergillus ruber CBS 135680]|uniref:2EXR domain-containing protein n=1 Tax=Aspergillus ruber (strain CBS 135680) TaxID=1388766 RepID=A0A017S1L2_ASPRC|nr:uncharacterized protein EURHEDRAFT_417144 [Aspergillus ruber CBS 135680]EYE90721.1 hypothetical protein EURHEDRAFT_417144 [Aspergillus ruber CBS 135680]